MARRAPLSRTAVALSLLLLAVLIPTSSATGTLSLPLQRYVGEKEQGLSGRGIYKRQTSAGTVGTNVFDVLPWSSGGAYYTNITVGTPPQVLTVVLDTGSSDLYVDAASSSACRDATSANTCRGGSFDPGASQSYALAEAGAFNTSFGDGSTASGDFGTDVVGVGDVIVCGVQFGVAYNVVSTTGFAVSLMGVGYALNEASSRVYPNMPEILRQAGAINSRLYSVFLNSQGDATGTILFGGIDTSKYTDRLHTLNMLPTPVEDPSSGDTIGVVVQFLVAITGVTVNANGKSTIVLQGGDPTGQDRQNSLQALLDTGSAAWTVPSAWYRRVAEAFGDALGSDGNLPCSHQQDDITIDIEFGGQASVRVPARNLVVPLYDPASNLQLTTRGGEPLCTLMLVSDERGQQQNKQGFLTLGDAVLRSMYLVFDLDNAQISIAPAVTNDSTSTSSAIQVVEAGPDGVAKAAGQINGGVATATANAYSIPPQLTPSQTLSFSSATSPVGTATGTLAVPQAGQVTPGSLVGGGQAAASSSGAASTNIPLSTLMPPARVMIIAAVMVLLGSFLVL